MTTECGAGLHDGLGIVAHCSLEPGHEGWHADGELGRAWAPTMPVDGLPHMPGCTDPDHRPLTSPCTTEHIVGVLPWASA